jgi:hypothetical protein
MGTESTTEPSRTRPNSQQAKAGSSERPKNLHRTPFRPSFRSGELVVVPPVPCIHGGGVACRLERHQGEGAHQLHPRRPRRRILVRPPLPSISSPCADQMSPISIAISIQTPPLLPCFIHSSPLVFFICCGSYELLFQLLICFDSAIAAVCALGQGKIQVGIFHIPLDRYLVHDTV